MSKTFLKGASIVSVCDYSSNKKNVVKEVLVGVVMEDTTFRFRPFEQIVTSAITDVTAIDGGFEIRTKRGSIYVINSSPKLYEISIQEFNTMSVGQYSPEKIIQLRRNITK